MRARIHSWLEHRSGYRKLIDVLLIEHIPGGAKWRYVWGSCLAFVFMVQLLTGVLLMTGYSPGDSTAWSSVYFIQYEMDFGWLIRGLHHFGSQAMVVLLGVHMLQVVIAGAHLPPREVNWWLGLALLGAVLALSLTGYLLPWDQKGYWATQVATNIAGNLPLFGPWMQKVIVGGPVYGHHTLTRFYALHVGILPPLVIVLIIAHLTVFRRHGVTTPKNAKGEGWFWPDQAFRDLLVSLLIFAVLLALVLWGHGHKVERPAAAVAESGSSDPAANAPTFYERMAHAGRDGRGANLDAPADPARPYPARPEWYFLFLFQLLKYFEGPQEIIGTVIIPNVALVLLALLPLLGYGRMRKYGHAVGVVAIAGLLISVGTLTYQALAEDRANTEKAKDFLKAVEEADKLGARAVQLAGDGIPAEGAVYLLRHDPLTMGEKLFGRYCASCHNHHGTKLNKVSATASDLAGFGTKEWIAGLLREPESSHYFGHTKLRTMSNWVKRTRTRLAKKEQELQEFEADLDRIAEWLAGHPGRVPPKQEDKKRFDRGKKAFAELCMTCHTYEGEGGGDAKGPDFTGYGDAAWVRMMLIMPNDELRYGSRNAMPSFRNLEGTTAEVARRDWQRGKEVLLKEIDDKDPRAEEKRKEIEAATKLVHLDDIERELIIRWLIKDYRVVFGGEPITGPAKH